MPFPAHEIFFVFSYSGFMLVSELKNFGTHEIEKKGCIITFYPPLKLARPSWRPIPQFDNESLKRVFPGAPDNVTPLRVAALPALDGSGRAVMKLFWDDNESETPFIDTFIVSVRGDNHAENGGSLAEITLQELIEWLRIETHQWSIGKPSEGLSGNNHLQIQVDKRRAVLGSPIAIAQNKAANDLVKWANPRTWAEAISKVREGRVAPNPLVLFADAAHDLFTNNVRTAVVLICSSLEMHRDSILEESGFDPSKLGHGTDILKHLTDEFERILKRNLKSEKPELYEFLKTLWIARGHLAHGKDVVWIFKGRRTSLEELTPTLIASNSHELHNWLCSLT